SHVESTRDGAEATLSGCWAVASLRPGLRVREPGLSAHAGRARHHLLDEPSRELLRQRRDGSVLLVREKRGRGSLRQLRRSENGVVRLHRGVLQPTPPPFDAWSDQSGGIRKTRGTAWGSCGKLQRTQFPTGSTRTIFSFGRRTKTKRESTYGNRPLNR